jgi:hypothetical protein
MFSYKTPFFDIVTANGYALSPARNKSLHAALGRAAQIANKEQLQHYIPQKHGLFQVYNCKFPA